MHDDDDVTLTRFDDATLVVTEPVGPVWVTTVLAPGTPYHRDQGEYADEAAALRAHTYAVRQVEEWRAGPVRRRPWRPWRR